MARRKIKRKYIDTLNKQGREAYWLEIVGVFLIAFSVFLLASFIFPGINSSFSMFFQDIFTLAFGWAHYIVPLIFIVIGIHLIYPQGALSLWMSIISSIVIVVDFAIFFHLYSQHGGAVGHRISSFLLKTIGSFGAYVFVIVLFVSAFLMLGKFSLKDVINLMADIFTLTAKGIAFLFSHLFRFIKSVKIPKISIPKFAPKVKQLTIYPEDENKEDDEEEIEEEIEEEEEPIPQVQSVAFKEEEVKPPLDKAVSSHQAEESEEPQDQIELFPGSIRAVKDKSSASSETMSPARKIKYRLPPTNILKGIKKSSRNKVISDYSQLLVDTLQSFGVDARVIHIERGPTVTRYELQPARGVKVSRITNLSNDIALVLAAQSIRIEAPIPGKSAIGIEIPNKSIDPVHIKDILESRQFKRGQEVPLGLGKDITGNPIVDSLIKMPHLLIAGATGSGKTVCINTVITSILFKYDPSQVQFLMIDPKRVELILYEGIPHLVENDFSEGQRIVTDPKKATLALRQLTVEMDKRYKRFAEVRARNIYEYNAHCRSKNLEKMPYLFLVIDELADLMLLSAATVETSICRLAQLGRASGIHLILATQRPSVDVITGLIKANVPSRIAFAVSSQIDSRTIIDRQGAEKLLGRGDMLYLPIDEADPRRIQGAYIDQDELERVVDFWANQPDPPNMIKLVSTEETGKDITSEDGDDTLLNEAINLITSTGQASTSYLQRKLRIGYARAGRIMDILEERGVVGPAEGSKPRKILTLQGSRDSNEE
ncbi:MAG: DNA translocase FtsK 4TM domain-containing protein [Armatimonadota bacterium]